MPVAALLDLKKFAFLLPIAERATRVTDSSRTDEPGLHVLRRPLHGLRWHDENPTGIAKSRNIEHNVNNVNNRERIQKRTQKGPYRTWQSI